MRPYLCTKWFFIFDVLFYRNSGLVQFQGNNVVGNQKSASLSFTDCSTIIRDTLFFVVVNFVSFFSDFDIVLHFLFSFLFSVHSVPSSSLEGLGRSKGCPWGVLRFARKWLWKIPIEKEEGQEQEWPEDCVNRILIGSFVHCLRSLSPVQRHYRCGTRGGLLPPSPHPPYRTVTASRWYESCQSVPTSK